MQKLVLLTPSGAGLRELNGRHDGWIIPSPTRLYQYLDMRLDDLSLGSIRIDGVAYEYDVVVDRGKIRKRKKKPSRKFRGQFGHTPLSIEEKIPWRCRRLVIGMGNHGGLPVMEDVKGEARRRKIDLVIVPTADAIKVLNERQKRTNAILHVTC